MTTNDTALRFAYFMVFLLEALGSIRQIPQWPGALRNIFNQDEGIARATEVNSEF
jgi:hypothetical protein